MSASDFLDPVPGVEPTRGGLYLWRYPPNVGAAVLFLLLFMGTFLHSSWKIWQTNAKFCIVFAVGCFLEMVGYGVRAGARNNTGKLMPFCVQNMFILIAPVLFAATIYMMLGRIIIGTGGEQHSLVRPSRITLIFVSADVLSFIIQGGGGGMSAVQDVNVVKWAERLVIIGLFIQIVMFATFCVLAVVFHMRMRRSPVAITDVKGLSWEADLWFLYAVSALIMVRSIFRVVEYIQGHTGYLLSHEWSLYVFDSLLMLVVAVLFCWRFPGHLATNKWKEPRGIPLFKRRVLWDV